LEKRKLTTIHLSLGFIVWAFYSLQSLTTKEAIDTSWDLTSKKEGEGEVFTTLAKLLKTANKSLKTKYDQPQLPNE